MKNAIPRVAAVHGLAGFGRASLAVVMPVLSALGAQVCPVPSAVMSTHTGGFGVPLFHDLTDTLEAYVSHWRSLGLEFDCIYSGFLASEIQIEKVGQFIAAFSAGPPPLVVVDPVMGDNGKVYRTYTPGMVARLGQLVKRANLITPNPTEAALLLNRPYTGCFSLDEIKDWLHELACLGPDTVVITGVECTDGCHANFGYDRSGKYWRVKYSQIPVCYPGTGDIFASVLIGGLLRGDDLPRAMDRATQFVSLAVAVTSEYGTVAREGVMLEKVIGWLCGDLTSCSYESIS